MKKSELIIFSTVALFLIGLIVFFKQTPTQNPRSHWSKTPTVEQIEEIKKVKETRKEINLTNLNLGLNSAFNQEIAFIINMGIPMSEKRFFVYNLKSKKILETGFVAHGSGSETGEADKLQFSNIPNSHATSLGRYKIANSYFGQYGKAYKLHGLDKTNSKAFERAIVLHKYDKLNEDRMNYYSQGCPMVSPKFFEKLCSIIDNSSKPIMLYIYYEV